MNLVIRMWTERARMFRGDQGDGMLVSIVINNYNYGRYVGVAIESALGQSYPHKEIIVVDDGSSDDSLEVIRRFEGKGVQLVAKENGGQASALNRGLEVARGEMVQFLDADDLLDINCTAELVRAWEPGLAAIQFYLRLCDREGQPKPEGGTMPRRLQESGHLVQQLALGFYYYSPTSGNFYCREALRKLFPIPESEFRLCADTYVQTGIPFVGRVKALSQTLGSYRIHGDNGFYSASFSRDPKQLRWAVDSDRRRHELIKSMADHYEVEASPRLDRCWLPLISRQLALRIHVPDDPLIAAHSRWKLLRWGVRAAPLYGRRQGLGLCVRVLFKMVLGTVLPLNYARRLLAGRAT